MTQEKLSVYLGKLTRLVMANNVGGGSLIRYLQDSEEQAQELEKRVERAEKALQLELRLDRSL